MPTRSSNPAEFEYLASLVRQSRINSGTEQAILSARGLAADFGYNVDDLLRAAVKQ